MATVNFKLRSQTDKEVSIYVLLSLGRNNLHVLKTGFKIHPNDWNKKTNLPKQTTPENKNITTNLKKLDSYISGQINIDLGKGNIIDTYWLESKIKECFNRVEKTDTGLVINHTQYIIDNAQTRKVKGRSKLGLSKNRIKGYTTFRNLFKTYQTEIKKQVHFTDINKPFVDKFVNWLLVTKQYSMNNAGKQIDNLKTICIDAQKLGIPTNDYVNQIQGFSEDNDERYIQTLSFVELENIRTAKITKPYLLNARKWLLIGCEIGQRQSDLLNITPENIRYDNDFMYLDIIQEKTNKNVTIGIIEPNVKKILINDFPHKISSQKLNSYIKEVCAEAGIVEVVEGKKYDAITKRKVLKEYPKNELITSHTFRRSFATNYYKKMPTAILINITGHSKESLFLSYINKREDKDENANLFMKFYKDIKKDIQKEIDESKNKMTKLTVIKNGTNS